MSCDTVNMKSCVSLFYYTLAIYLELVTCENGVCGEGDKFITCCSDYKKEGEKCLLCPKGSYGPNCTVTCPSGTYGAACRGTCNCETDEICDAVNGCIGNVNQSKNNWTSASEEITTIDEYEKREIAFQYLYIIPICVAWIISIVALSVRYRLRRRHFINADCDTEDIASQNEMQAVDFSEPSTQNQQASESEYAEICDASIANTDSYEISSIYNELSFSKLKPLKKMNSPLSALYDTAATCVVKTEAKLHNESTLNLCYDTAKDCAVNNEAVVHIENPVDSCYDTAQACAIDTEAVLHIENLVDSCYAIANTCTVDTEAVLHIKNGERNVMNDNACGDVRNFQIEIDMENDKAGIGDKSNM